MAIRNSFLLLIISGIISCSPPKVEITSDFDHGSLGDMEEIEPNHFIGKTKHWLKRDSIGDQSYWFYFKADHIKDREVTFELADLKDVYRGNTQFVYTDYTRPVYSYDQVNWTRIPDVKYDTASHIFRFTETFSSEPVWIAYAHPYPTSRLSSLLREVKKSVYMKIEKIATTKEGRDINLCKITDRDVPGENKKNVMVLALQHAGEDSGGYMAEGMIRFLLSNDPEAEKARKQFNYIIVPMMNPDGIYNGTSRYNMEMEDLNNVWLDEEHMQPENIGIINWLDSWYAEGKEIDLFLDIHNHTQKYQYHTFIFEGNELDSVGAVMNKHWPIRTWHSEFKGSSCAYASARGILSGTIELSQSHLDNGIYLHPKDYVGYGKSSVIALNEYFIVD